jgi:hypothetical protein
MNLLCKAKSWSVSTFPVMRETLWVGNSLSKCATGLLLDLGLFDGGELGCGQHHTLLSHLG